MSSKFIVSLLIARFKYDKKELQEVVSTSYSKAEVLKKLGIKVAGGNYTTLDKYLKEYEIDTSHFRGKGWNVGLKFKPNPSKPLVEILVEYSTYQSYKLKRRLFEEGVKTKQCESCKRSEWMGKPIPLELHHKNGIKTDHRLKNLLILCPNCHAHTDNYRGKTFQSECLGGNP